MFFLLASGYRKRYLDEVVRSLSLPHGALINLRYLKKWLSPKALDLVQSQKTNERCLICYVYFDDDGSTIVPLRFGKIESTEDSGSFVVVTIAVDDFANCYDRSLFIRTIKEKAKKIPNESDDGFFFTELEKKASLDGVSNGPDKEFWERTVVALKEFEDFKKNKYNFFRLDGIFPNKSRWRKSGPVKVEGGQFIIDSGSSYHLKFSFYDTYSSEFTNKIKASSDSNINFYTPTLIPIDTSYDVRIIRFKTSVNSFTSFGHINIDTCGGETVGEAFSGIDFDIIFKINGNFIYNFVVGSVFGIFLFLANMKISTAANSGALSEIKLLIELNWIRFLLSWGAGLVASFGIKKPFW